MIYLCAGNLESRFGLATASLNQMLSATAGPHVQVVVETGGARTWQNGIVNPRVNQRYQVRGDGLALLETDLGPRNMALPATLADFIRYSCRRFPARRYLLVFWGHGQGLAGCAYDERVGGEALSLPGLRSALAAANCPLELVGFDACSMATLETAAAVWDHAQYLVASQAPEPQNGWDYAHWLGALCQRPQLSPLAVGQMMADGFAAACARWHPDRAATLSVIHLGRAAELLFPALAGAGREIYARLEQGRRERRAGGQGVLSFSGCPWADQIDLASLGRWLGTPAGDALARGVARTVAYNRPTVEGAGGLSLSLPWRRPWQGERVWAAQQALGFPPDYGRRLKEFLALGAVPQA